MLDRLTAFDCDPVGCRSYGGDNARLIVARSGCGNVKSTNFDLQLVIFGVESVRDYELVFIYFSRCLS